MINIEEPDILFVPLRLFVLNEITRREYNHCLDLRVITDSKNAIIRYLISLGFIIEALPDGVNIRIKVSRNSKTGLNSIW